MIAARRQLDRLAGLDRKPLLERAHRHHAIVHGHLVDFDLAGDVSGPADQPVRRSALVLDGEIAAADLGPPRRGAAPGLRDHEIAGLDLLGAERVARKFAIRKAHAAARATDINPGCVICIALVLLLLFVLVHEVSGGMQRAEQPDDGENCKPERDLDGAVARELTERIRLSHGGGWQREPSASARGG